MLASRAGTLPAGPRQTELQTLLCAFINEAAQANIVAGVQVSLLNELAVQFAGKQALLEGTVRPLFPARNVGVMRACC